MLCCTMLTKNRRQMLPYVLKCLFDVDYPKNELCFLFIDDGSTDGSYEYLMDIQKEFKDRYIDIKRIPYQIFDCNSSRIIQNYPDQIIHPYIIETNQRSPVRLHLFYYLAYLRNLALQYCRERGYITHQWSLDSDILVYPGILNHLLKQMKENEDIHYLASIIFNDAHCERRFNYNPDELLKRHVNFGVLVYPDEITQDEAFDLTSEASYGNFDFQLNHIYTGVITGATYLADRVVLNSSVEYAYHACGEDIPYTIGLYKKGIPCSVDTRVQSLHVMEEQFLTDALVQFELFRGTYENM